MNTHLEWQKRKNCINVVNCLKKYNAVLFNAVNIRNNKKYKKNEKQYEQK